MEQERDIMYKKQMSLQRIFCLLSLAASVVVFVYSLGIMTDLFDTLYSMIPDPDDLENTRVAGARIYYDMQGFNRGLLYCGIVLILLSCLLFLTNTHIRRRYYIGNYCAVGLNAVANVGVAVWAHIQIAAFKNQYLTTVDFAQLERRLGRLGTYTDSTFWFDIHYFVFALTLIATALLVVNVILKIRLMKEEAALLKNGKAVSA